MRKDAPDRPRADGNLTGLIAQIDHAAGVVRRMRDFLRRGQPHVSTIDVVPMIEEALARKPRTLAAVLAVESVEDYKPPLPPLEWVIARYERSPWMFGRVVAKWPA